MIIEHNIEFVARIADYVIDFGTHGGNKGGKVVAQGLPKQVFQNPDSSLNVFVKSD